MSIDALLKFSILAIEQSPSAFLCTHLVLFSYANFALSRSLPLQLSLSLSRTLCLSAWQQLMTRPTQCCRSSTRVSLNSAVAIPSHSIRYVSVTIILFSFHCGIVICVTLDCLRSRCRVKHLCLRLKADICSSFPQTQLCCAIPKWRTARKNRMWSTYTD